MSFRKRPEFCGLDDAGMRSTGNRAFIHKAKVWPDV